jgi:transcriptional regulator with XRE-family HTH domain
VCRNPTLPRNRQWPTALRASSYSAIWKGADETRSANQLHHDTGRDQREQTLTGLSVELGISHQQLQKYETGSNRLSAGMIARLSEVFGVPVTALFQKPENMFEGRAHQQPGRMDALRREAALLIDRTHTENSLKLMVDVLRVLDGNC